MQSKIILLIELKPSYERVVVVCYIILCNSYSYFYQTSDQKIVLTIFKNLYSLGRNLSISQKLINKTL